MRIGILGTGTLAAALGTAWVRAGHDVTIGGRSPTKAQALAHRLGARAGTVRDAVAECAAVLLAVPWYAVADVLHSAGSLDGTVLIDPTNAVEHGVGVLLTGPGGSGAQRIAALAPGAHVVKAFHLHPAGHWASPGDAVMTVAMCGDDPAALRIAGELVRAAGGVPAVLGSLSRARQLEEVAGFVIGLAFRGVDPNSAIPRL